MEKTKEILVAIASSLKSYQVTFTDENSVEILRFEKKYRVTKHAMDFQVESINCDKSFSRDEVCAFLEKKFNYRKE
jgi:hypothetical protein